MVDTARDVIDVPSSRAQNFSWARSASGKFFMLSEAKARSRRIDFEKSLENWRNWVVSSRAARNFAKIRAVWPSNFAKKVSERFESRMRHTSAKYHMNKFILYLFIRTARKSVDSRPQFYP